MFITLIYKAVLVLITMNKKTFIKHHIHMLACLIVPLGAYSTDLKIVGPTMPYHYSHIQIYSTINNNTTLPSIIDRHYHST